MTRRNTRRCPRKWTWQSPCTLSWQFRLTPKMSISRSLAEEISRPIDGTLLSSEERRRKREADIWNQQLALFIHVLQTQWLPPHPGTEPLHYTRTPALFFPSFTLILPVISPPAHFSPNRLDFLIRLRRCLLGTCEEWRFFLCCENYLRPWMALWGSRPQLNYSNVNQVAS